jgi:prolyl-tRNA synthetase
MRATQLLTKTLREAPRDTEGRSHELLVRAGLMRQLTSGVYSLLPLGSRVIQKISQIVREEMNRAGGQEVIMPVLQPRELWEERPANDSPNRAELYGPVLFSLKDRRERGMVLGPTHEEVVTLLVKDFVRSYRDLPQLIYQIQVKERDEPRPRGGLLRSREFLMKDLYSFDTDQAGLDISYGKMAEAYRSVFMRCGLRFIVIHADSGAIGGKASQEFIASTDAGGDEALVCDTCEYAANVEAAEFVRSDLQPESEGVLAEIHTPNTTAIADLATLLHIPTAKILKTVTYVADDRIVVAVVRGDLAINEIKLVNVLQRNGVNATDLHLGTSVDMEKAGFVTGYVSPVNASENAFIVADSSVRNGNNYVAGANKMDFHFRNVNPSRDVRVDVWDDIASAYEGAVCPQCGGVLHIVRGSEAGHIFKLGTKYSELFGATYLDADGVSHPILMGCYGIGITRLMAIVIEQRNDERGIIWPFSIAPYQVALLGLDLADDEIRQAAEQLYAELTKAGVEVLYDDRLVSAGVKFNDADLLGLPVRAVISKRSLKSGGIELRLRTEGEGRIAGLEGAVHDIRDQVLRGIADNR